MPVECQSQHYSVLRSTFTDKKWIHTVVPGHVVWARVDDMSSSSERPETRVVFHLDLDCFYAQVEEGLNPELKGCPIAVQQQALTVTANYVARRRGVHKLDNITNALRACPDLKLVPSVMEHYREASLRVFSILRGFSKKIVVEKGGIDEAYLDLSAMIDDEMSNENSSLKEKRNSSVSRDLDSDELVKIERFAGADAKEGSGTFSSVWYNSFLIGDTDWADQEVRRLHIGARIASEIRQRIFDLLGYTTSGGVSMNKTLAKLVADEHKPGRQTVLLPGGVSPYMNAVQLRKIPGLGPKLRAALRPLNANTGGDLQRFAVSEMENFVVESSAKWLFDICRGVDMRQVVDKGRPKSYGVESHIRTDNYQVAIEMLRVQAIELWQRIERDCALYDRMPIHLTLKFRSSRFVSRTRTAPLPTSKLTVDKIFDVAQALFDASLGNHFSLSLLGLHCSRFRDQMTNRAPIARFLRTKRESDDGKEDSEEQFSDDIPGADSARVVKNAKRSTVLEECPRENKQGEAEDMQEVPFIPSSMTPMDLGEPKSSYPDAASDFSNDAEDETVREGKEKSMTRRSDDEVGVAMDVQSVGILDHGDLFFGASEEHPVKVRDALLHPHTKGKSVLDRLSLERKKREKDQVVDPQRAPVVHSGSRGGEPANAPNGKVGVALKKDFPDVVGSLAPEKSMSGVRSGSDVVRTGVFRSLPKRDVPVKKEGRVGRTRTKRVVSKVKKEDPESIKKKSRPASLDVPWAVYVVQQEAQRSVGLGKRSFKCPRCRQKVETQPRILQEHMDSHLAHDIAMGVENSSS